VVRAQRLEHHHLVDAIHELRRKLAPRRFHRSAVDLFVEAIVEHVGLLQKAEAAVHQVGHLAGAEVRRHDDDAKISPCVEAQFNNWTKRDSTYSASLHEVSAHA